ncbi:MAG: carboxymuconolactone decarboxylase family protein [candidate division NC10 bacterium]|jgi:AhpD family alkylhydroperoxidase
MAKGKKPPPQLIRDFQKRFPQVWEAYVQLREACDREGPLSPRELELIKVGISAALRREGGLIAHIDRAREVGASPEQIYQAILVATGLTGFPNTLAAFGIARDRLGST